jgi:hypothetical protein
LLPAVIGLGMVMLLLIATALAVTSSGSQKAATETNWNAALAAAYAGVEDYKSRIENDVRYSRYGNPDAPFGENIVVPSGEINLNEGLVDPPEDNPAFAVGEGGDWAVVPGSNGKAQFRYEVNIQDFASTGVILLRATGKVGDSTRSLVASLKQEGFSDYVYFTEYEAMDPNISGRSECENIHQWGTSVGSSSDDRSSNCRIQFAAVDTLGGKVHSNDQLYICGGNFKGAVTSASPIGSYVQAPSCPGPTFKSMPERVGAINMPDDNNLMKAETYLNYDGVPVPGCLYTGPTTVKFNGNGQMTVWSPWTKYTQIEVTGSVGTAGENPAKCGLPAELASAAGATIDVLDANLMYVQNVPAAATSDVNSWAAGTYPAGFTCTDDADVVELFQWWGGSYNPKRYQTTKYGEKWTFQTNVVQPGHSGTDKYISHPLSNEKRPAYSSAEYPAYGCRNGDLYVSGTIGGRTTIAAENYVYVQGDVLYKDPSRDVLGLVGNNAIFVWNPMPTSGSSPILDSDDDRVIQAALMSVDHTIQVQNYDKGNNRGELTIYGSMAQKYRGTVATSSGGGGIATGYSKDYNHDPKLANVTPPKYLMPTSTTFTISKTAGVPAAFSSNGAEK